MTAAAVKSGTQEIVFDEVFPHTPAAIWRVLTTGELINRWLMAQKGFVPVKGNHFSFQTPPDGEWDGVIHCEVLEAMPNERLVYTWKSGHESNGVYVSRLDTVVTWTLARNDGGTRLRIVHSGFIMPKNLAIFQNVNAGWSKVVPKLIAIVAEEAKATVGKKS
ncbi:MAG TPA: SRPBCC domain-containing protein [Aestuariivirga sp.]|nr:SRPBCC domain-containing protein [Aestuariivirga sp.]